VWVTKMVKSWKFWAALIALPLFLVGCSGLIINFDSDFTGDEFVARKQIQAGDLSVSYLSAGDPSGQRVIFLHGTPGNAEEAWYNMLKEVPKGYEFLAIDRPGFGHTKPDHEVTSLNAQAAALEPLLVTRGGKGTILVGHSLGGPIIAAAAINYPNKVAGIVIAAGALDPDLEEVLFIQRVGNVPPFSWLLDKTLRNSNRELIDLETELRALQPKLASIRQPVMIIHGTEDQLVPYANVAFMQRAFTGTKHIGINKIEGMDHFLQWSKRPEIIAGIEKISLWLDETRIMR
jgi:pimeloyl-ACP methyl ester carboxylesterase